MIRFALDIEGQTIQRTIHLDSLQKGVILYAFGTRLMQLMTAGYRHVSLRDSYNKALGTAKLFVLIEKKSLP